MRQGSVGSNKMVLNPYSHYVEIKRLDQEITLISMSGFLIPHS